MRVNLLTRHRKHNDQEVKEPTLLALALTIVGIIVMADACVAGIVFLPAFGYIWWTFAAVAAILVCLVLSFRGRTRPTPPERHPEGENVPESCQKPVQRDA